MPEYYIREAHNGEAALSLEAYTKNLYGLGKSSHARTCVEARKRDPDIVTLLGLEKAGIAHNTLSLPEFARDAVSIIASEESASPNTRNITWIHTRIKKRGFASKAMDKFKESFPVGYTLRTEPGACFSWELSIFLLTQEFTADIEIETAEIPYPDESPGRKSHRISFSWTKPHPDDASVAFQDHLTHVKKIREKQGARGRSDRSHEFAEELDCVIAKLEARSKDMIDANVGPNVSSGAAEMKHDEDKAEVDDDAEQEQVCQFEEWNASLFKKPRGRPRKGKTWDPVSGCWVEKEKHDEDAATPIYRSSHRALSTGASAPLKSPPGPAPDGKYWDPILGDWMLQQDEEDREETGSRWLAEAEKYKQESAALYRRVFGHSPPPPDAVQRRPRGRAPKGKKWVDHQGWVTDNEDDGEDEGEEVEAEIESLSSHPVSGDSEDAAIKRQRTKYDNSTGGSCDRSVNADRFDHGEDPYSYPQIYRVLRNTPSHLQHVSGQTVREESGNAAFSSPKSTQSEVVSTPAAEAGKTDVLPNASFVLSPIVQPIVPRKSKKSGRNLIPKLRTEVDANFEAIHFKATKASNFGDCYPLSSVAGFEITDLAEIANPTTKTIEFIRKLRVRSIDGVCGDSPIGGIRADITRQQEGVMARSLSASRQMSQWKNSGHWISDNRKLSAFFQFAIAYKGIDRPVACIEIKNDTYYYDPIRIYGYKNPTGDLYVEPGTANKPASPPCFKTMPIEDVVNMLRTDPKSMSLVKYNGNDHFDPIVFCPPVSENNVTTM